MNDVQKKVSDVISALEPLNAADRAAELERLRSTDPDLASEVEHLLASSNNARNLNHCSVTADIWWNVGANDSLPHAHLDVAEEPDAIPPLVPGYELKPGKENIRFGGMGVVYFGIDAALGRPVAVKVLRRRLAGDLDLVSRFEREARINAQLQHPGIVPVYQVGKLADERPFYTMKLVEGETFSDVLKRRPSPAHDLLGVLTQFRRVCEAMAYAHAHNVLHRDLKPANIMVGLYGEVLLMDWGLAKVLGEAAPSSLIPMLRRIDPGSSAQGLEHTKGILGTLLFMPPEQAAGWIDEVDKRSDVFGLGAILCTILTGSPPYQVENEDLTQRKAMRGDLEETHLRLAQCGVDAELSSLARKCLSYCREDRPDDAEQVAKAIGSYLAGVEERRRQAELDQVKAEAEAREQRKRRRIQLALVLALGLLLLTGGAFAWWEDKQSARRQMEVGDRQREERDRKKHIADALARLLGICEDALKVGDVNRARTALSEAEEHALESGGETWTERLVQCRMDLAMLAELDRIETIRWTPIDNQKPGPTIAAGLWRAAFEKYGLVGGAVSVPEPAQRVADSLIKDRLLGALDLCLMARPSNDVRAILKEVDPDAYREAVRNSFINRDRASVGGVRQPARGDESAGGVRGGAWPEPLDQNHQKTRHYEGSSANPARRPRAAAEFGRDLSLQYEGRCGRTGAMVSGSAGSPSR